MTTRTTMMMTMRRPLIDRSRHCSAGMSASLSLLLPFLGFTMVAYDDEH